MWTYTLYTSNYYVSYRWTLTNLLILYRHNYYDIIVMLVRNFRRKKKLYIFQKYSINFRTSIPITNDL